MGLCPVCPYVKQIKYPNEYSALIRNGKGLENTNRSLRLLKSHRWYEARSAQGLGSPLKRMRQSNELGLTPGSGKE